jgi:S1-C subfamily serine protease
VSQKAGLQVGDVIMALDGTVIRSVDDVRIDLLYRKKGEIIKVKALRAQTEMEFEVIL